MPSGLRDVEARARGTVSSCRRPGDFLCRVLVSVVMIQKSEAARRHIACGFKWLFFFFFKLKVSLICWDSFISAFSSSY